MFQAVSGVLGGVGLFLLGMSLLGDGLKSLAGDALRRALVLFTKRPVTAFFSGMVATAIVQSSSATTLMTIGFVSAGMLTFQQSVGVLVGASLGTSSTGWIVALLGLKLSISSYALLFVAFGASCRLFFRGSVSAAGTATAGFGLVFIGIELLKTGMEGMTSTFQFTAMPDHGLSAHLLVASIGVVLTVLVQSSSAAIAMTLTALFAGAISFEQAASLAVGAAIGTTVTGVIGSIGAGVHARRTALAHVLFNLGTGVLALVLMPVLLRVVEAIANAAGWESPAIRLAMFHSTFLLLGVLIILPFLGAFSRGVERLVPDRGNRFAGYLDQSLQNLPALALDALRRSLIEMSASMASIFQRLLEERTVEQTDLDAVKQAVGLCMQYLSRIRLEADDRIAEAARVNDIHILDHLQRLVLAVGNGQERLYSENLRPWSQRLGVLLQSSFREPGVTEQASYGELEGGICKFSAELAKWRRQERKRILQSAATQSWEPEPLLEELETLQWMDQVAYHFCRIQVHLGREAVDEE